jgi:hypothetical protein
MFVDFGNPNKSLDMFCVDCELLAVLKDNGAEILDPYAQILRFMGLEFQVHGQGFQALVDSHNGRLIIALLAMG